MPYAKRLEILVLDALQTRRIKSDVVLCYSVVQTGALNLQDRKMKDKEISGLENADGQKCRTGIGRTGK